MSKNNRSQDFVGLLGVSIGVLAGEIPAPTAIATNDPWIKVTPRGSVKTRDGRAYNFSPEQLVERYKSDGVDLPADFDHGIALNAIKGVKTPAIGWANDLQARPDGTYAKMDWLPEGKAALAARSHRYVSPTFHHDPSGDATWLHSIALVTAPAMALPAVASTQMVNADDVTMLATLAADLGLPKGSDLGALLKAVSATLANSVPKHLHDSALAMAMAAQSSLSTLAGDVRAGEVKALIDGALRETKILPFQREEYLAICSTDAGFENVKRLLSTALPYVKASGLDAKPVPGNAVPENPRTLAARASAYVEEQRKAGLTVTHAHAVRVVIERES